ncbi:molybdate ABC transporter substrate-binding protein [Modestobacter sp. I12A-02628]|uniref:Molybdate ABC transporter substrate-binding protein n=1 Tax=Goekera deserti TaxID=2497753 RepID=A0A7K3WJC4_9ACTN|nr:molybdate ABC transporter substrate-binding protein [Goekera deserti]MPR00525.1 molybdate ABC transporter substrate-binding protein [Goekera deserti]NDI50461.1 molybdate ABC transporter substrate-binding protein [Goekera deserti]NEL56557.1 molybdate ABC transporter substrate-binding protein [Goekera deserti]
MLLRTRLALTTAAVLALTSCGGSSTGSTSAGSSSAGSSSASAGGDLSGTLTVFAAASLTEVFGELGDQLEAENPDLTVQFNFAGSSALATQLTEGAPADVFASANEQQMTVVTDAALAEGTPTVFTENVLEIAVPPGNPGDVIGLADFADPDLTLAVCAAAVPCGAAAQAVFADAGITPVPDTEEEDVKAALTKVQLGEVDAALVYATDVQAAGDAVEGIEFPEAEQEVNSYPIAVLAAAPNADAAQAFVDLVRSDTGQQALEAAGFRSP